MFFGIRDPGSEIRDPGWEKPGSGIRDKHPGSATLLFNNINSALEALTLQSINCQKSSLKILCFYKALSVKK
jgi:hypothetical protein